MTVGDATGGGNSRNLILAAMIFAVAMTFIDQTIVSIAAPEIQQELGLTSTGVQWAVNAYLLSLAALCAFGPQLCRQLGPGDSRHDPGHADARPDHHLADRVGDTGWAGSR